MENKKKTLMITGASGFIGTNFIERYKEKYNIGEKDECIVFTSKIF